ncbi:deubiquitinase OTUD6B-like isoform X2 [Dreissena polymorpha]|uniref:deubiquitinase OTUD6B-like isoform X2 n=1 Tax=Dreissena polymorpha TaxID=45954 RepID=UPI002264AE4B|nr:deubiquitinase OTUD6B-like isoform X2 [Dreissena polymorpha]
MADAGDDKCDAEAELLQRHKKERKDLQSEIQKLKHSVSKDNKKKKKEITDKIALLEAELDCRHEKELADLKLHTTGAPQKLAGTVDEVVDKVGVLGVGDNEESDLGQQAQKKAKKAAEDQEREDRIREQAIENLTSSRHLEAVKIGTLLAHRGLQIHEITSDGNCLYAAISHQLKKQQLMCTVDSLRGRVAEYMRSNPEEFMPFLTTESGEPFSEEDFEKYCHELETTPAWGGQLEIQALAQVLKVPIEVIQSEGPSLVSGEHFTGSPIVLTYYRHAYGLGEHYHSVEDRVETEEEFT